MKLKTLGPNQTQIETSDGAVVLFSYNTPVAAQRSTGGFIRTEKFWGVTTSKHINKWLGGAHVVTVPQSDLDAIAN
jgi:hypothetical protein